MIAIITYSYQNDDDDAVYGKRTVKLTFASELLGWSRKRLGDGLMIGCLSLWQGREETYRVKRTGNGLNEKRAWLMMDTVRDSSLFPFEWAR